MALLFSSLNFGGGGGNPNPYRYLSGLNDCLSYDTEQQ